MTREYDLHFRAGSGLSPDPHGPASLKNHVVAENRCEFELISHEQSPV
jgi:hypothetical protein